MGFLPTVLDLLMKIFLNTTLNKCENKFYLTFG